MSRALAEETKPLLLTYHSLLRELEAKRWEVEEFEAMAPRFAKVEAQAQELLESQEAAEGGEFCERLADVASAIHEAQPSPDGALEQLRASWAEKRARLQESYDALWTSMRELSVLAPSRRPENYARSLLHVFTATVCILLVQYVLSPFWMIVVAGVGVVWCWSMEIGRVFSERLNELLLRSMALVAHPHERSEVNSATWYTTALLILAACFEPEICVVALAVLGLADPAAALVGRRWGRLRLIHGRSLEGTLTFAAVGTLAGFGALSLWYGSIPSGQALALAAGGACAGGLAELFSRRIDDNLSIPVAAASGAWAVGQLCFAPPPIVL